MLHAPTRRPALFALALILAALALLPAAHAQTPADKDKQERPFHDYKGVRIGMAADEARKLLGAPTDKDDKQEVFSVAENETCQVYYDATKKVSAVSVTYF